MRVCVCVRVKAERGECKFAIDAHVLFMRGQRICGIKALSNIKQNGEQQSKEELGKKINKRKLRCMTSLCFLQQLYLSIHLL